MLTDKSFIVWEDPGHIQTFEYSLFYPRPVLIKKLESFNEIKILNSLKRDRKEAFSLLDIGCATGEFYRYFKTKYPNLDYYGCDVSQRAIERAKEKFPQANFFVINRDLDQLKYKNKIFDIIFCRDVIIHQPDPFLFLKRLCDLSFQKMILRLRTRDIGKTVLDNELSCQLYYDIWTPYMILNCDEIVSFLNKNCPDISFIKFQKHYMVLGGLVNRYLPKDTYFQHTKTAETAMLIEKRPQNSTPLKLDAVENDERISYITIILVKVLSKIVQLVVGRKYIGKVWW